MAEFVIVRCPRPDFGLWCRRCALLLVIMLLQELSDVFSAGGPLAQAVPDYRPRQAQLELAQAIEDTLGHRSTLVAEAGTGTGKTWAYLVPAFLGGSKVLVSTGTRTLQDQLFHRDVPRLRSALQVSVNVALLKGRSNYVCHYFLDRMSGDDRALKSRAEIAQFRQIQVFTQQSDTGDKSELATVPEEADIWNRVTSTRDNCLGQDCPHVRDCFVLKARRRAQDADIVIVNHALYMADLALREEGITDLLPEVDLVVFDEAHQLPDVATRFLGSSVSSHQLLDLARTMQVAGLAHAREATPWQELAGELETAARDLRLQSAGVALLPGRKATFDAVPDPENFDVALARLLDVLARCIDALMLVKDTHPDLMATAKTALDLRARVFAWSQPDRSGKRAQDHHMEGLLQQLHEPDTPPDTPPDTDPETDHDVSSAIRRALDDGAVRWIEHTQNHVRLHRAPLSISNIFSRYRPDGQAWVFTSATLSVNGNFSHFTRQLGLGDARTQSWTSPFDYAAQGLLYVPSTLPLPSHPAFNEAFVQALFPLIQESAGGVLVLCTTLRAVDRIAELLGDCFTDAGLERPLLRQGDASRLVLLDEFRKRGNAVLVGSASFWEGIDVPGDALTLVAIDKLPFAPPDDPVLQARLNRCRSQGGNPFMEYQLPEAAIALKQGAGRLIRSERDKGVLLVGDTRMVDKPYGRLLWRGLPPFARTRDAGMAVDFIRRLAQA